MLYNPPSGSTDPNAKYVGKNVAAGTQGSKVPPEAVEYTQREVVAAIAASNQAPSNDVLVQLPMAMARGIFVGNLTGTGDLAVATLGVALPTLLQGMRIGAVATATNTVTTPKLRVMNLGSVGLYQDFPIVKEDGSAVAVGYIKVGRRYRYEADGAGNVAITGGGAAADVAQSLDSRNIVGGNYQQYATPGTYTWTVPAGVTKVRTRIWGGGGGGGAGSSSASGGSGGGGGGYGEGTFTVTPGQTLTIVVGAGGAAGAASTTAPGAGGVGGTSSVSFLMSATGGQGGQAGNGGTATQLSNSGSPSGAQLGVSGYFGGLAFTINGVVQGGSGGAAFGASQPPINVAPSGGNPGMFPGGGAGGAAGYAAGGLGAPGFVIIEY